MSRLPRATWVIWLVVALVAGGAAGASAFIADSDEQQAMVAAERQAETVARATEASLNRNFLGIDLMLAGLSHMPGLLGPDGRLADTSRVAAILRASANQSLTAHDLALVDDQGRVVAAADPATPRLGVALPKGFLAGVLAQHAPRLVFSTPLVSATTAEKVLYLARPLPIPSGARLIALAEVPVASLTTIMASAVGVDGLTVTLETTGGMLLASAPANDSLLGRVNPVPLPATLGAGRRAPVAQRAPGRLDGAPAYMAVRPTLYGSVLVSAAISEAAALARARESRDEDFAVSAVFIVLAVVIGALTQVSLARMAVAAAETARAKSVLEEALASMEEGFLLWDADDRVVSWNARYLEMFPHLRGVVARGVHLHALAEAGARAYLPDADQARREAWIAERLAIHRSDGREYEMRPPDGRVVSVVERGTANGGIVSVYRDITRAKAAAEELVAARHTAEAASEAKTRFLATMSHEIRTPLNGVLGMNGLLLETPLDERQRRYAETIRSSGEALLDILNDVLDMSKLEAGRMALEIAAFAPEGVVEEVVSLLGARAAAKGIAVRVEGVAGSPRLLGDAGRVRQVLFNLVGNAIKFTDRGSVTVRTDLRRLSGRDVEWAITVSDTGIGIPAAAMATLFDRFTQADTSTSRRFGGSGLGLAICRQLVELMHGRIEVSSRFGEGSAFVVKLPLPLAHGAAEEPPAPAREASVAGADSATGQPLRVLVAEDNRVNQMLVVAMLERLGHVADVVGDGREALRQVQLARYDLVLMDIQMPEMDGVEATRAIRALPGTLGRIPIVAVSANVLPEQRAAYLAVGMNDYVAKPFDRERLEAVIAELMASA